MSSSNSAPPIENQLSIEENSVEIKTKNDMIGRFFERQRRYFLDELRELFTFHPKEWLNAFRRNSQYPLFVRGDIDGLFALFIDNMATLLAIILTLQPVLDSDIIYGKIVTGVALAMVWGNIYYVYMARKLAYKEKRGDICAMPYGINTPGAFAFVFGIIYPAYYKCMDEGNGQNKRTCQELAWYTALGSNFIAGIIILVLCLFGEFIRRNTPSVALLSSISAVGFTYLTLNQYLTVSAIPMVSFLPFSIIILGYSGKIKFGPIPIACVALVTGTALAWITSTNDPQAVRDASKLIKPYPAAFPVKGLFENMHRIGPYLSTTIPTAISIAIGTIQCVESAKRAGDFYPTRESMFADGTGTIIASLFGSILGMTTYIGHPAFKRMGARQAYSVINCFAYLLLCFFGIIALFLKIIAVVAVNPIIIFVGLFICSETLAITPQRHYPAFLLGLTPVLADWAKGTIINGVAAAYSNFTAPNVNFAQNVTSRITDFSYRGLSNLAGGSLLQCIFITAIIMYMTDRKFIRGAVWSLLAGLLAFFGLIHSSNVGVLYQKNDDGWRFTVGYGIMILLFILLEIGQRLKWIEGPENEPDDLSSEEWAEWHRLAQHNNNHTRF
ncbi:unnamed protein product [Adineta ricciae]|uniref:Uncharacterized protein n=1 Tax=Adineta ricciae TaxID=249248 RepID=A0A815QIX1_ADIRI|nr:unnamed protein product [Adineta ricciae]CAF1601581.1 unnamed protein product [Adineta ricciae]